jgi:hypothetical protein
MHKTITLVKEETKATIPNIKAWPTIIPLLGQVGRHFPQVLNLRPNYFY